MPNFTEIAAVEVQKNPFQLVGREWMLVTAGTLDSFNTMTANWGTLGYLWMHNVAVCFVRPQRHTYDFMERSSVYTLTFFDETWRKALEYCGSHSGRDVDKMAETGLTPFATPGGSVAFEQARLVFECRKLYCGDLTAAGFVDAAVMNEHYPKRDFHRFYVGQIQRVLAR